MPSLPARPPMRNIRPSKGRVALTLLSDDPDFLYYPPCHLIKSALPAMTSR